MVEIRDKIERRATGALVPYARNSRTHADEQIDQLVASMREWGFTSPVLVDDRGGIIAGHGRVMAAQRLGLPEVPVIAAETHGRHARVMELDPTYMDVIVKRWQAFTGQEATLEATGQPWSVVVAERYEQTEPA